MTINFNIRFNLTISSNNKHVKHNPLLKAQPSSFASIIKTIFFLTLLQGCKAYSPSYQLNQDYSLLSCSLADSMSLSHLFPQCPPSTQRFPLKLLENNLVSSAQEARTTLSLSEEDLSCGNKHANLIEMADFVETLDHPLITIPRPQAIPSPKVMEFLKKTAPNVFKEWENLQRLYLNANSFSESKEAMEILAHIDAAIEKAFSNSDAYQQLGIPDSLLNQNDFLMVRSSGDEDSHESANAGGNASESYVSPNKKEICKAVGKVVKSYFSKPSLLNRLKANPNTFQQELKLGVTVQKLIGEPVGGAKDPSDIPVSFVLFTHEPLYSDVAKEKFRVMRLSATYGHGEGVVGNRGIATDTILILRSESSPNKIYYLYDNQAKNERLAPTKSKEGHIVLSKIQNPPDLKKNNALSRKQIVSLYTSAILMESFFENHSTDIEGVVKGDSIYFVQARPVNRKSMLPTYISHPYHSLKAQKTLVIGKASALIITDPKQVRFARTLEDAQNGSVPQLVITTGPDAEPENSHPVVNFSGLGVPCLHLPQNEEDSTQLLSSINSENPLVVCMQTGRIYKWVPSYGDPKKFIKEGFAVHPASIAISLSEDLVPSTQQTLDSSSPLYAISHLLDSQNTTDIENALYGLNEYLDKLREKIPLETDFIDSAPEISKYIDILKALKKNISHAIKETIRILETQTEGERLPLLFNIKKLKTLILGSDSLSPQLGRYALIHVDTLFDTIATLKTYQGKVESASLEPRLTHLVLYGKQGNAIAFTAWQEFLLKLEPLIAEKTISQKDLEKFTDFIGTLHTLDSLPFWMTFFQNDLKTSSPLSQFQNILTHVDTSNPNLMAEVIKEREYILQLHEQKELFASPHSLPLAWKDLQTLITTYSSETWLAKVQTASPIAKIAIYRMMESLVDLVDTAGKQVKSSHQFEGVEHVKKFQEMLFPFNQLMNTWAKNLIPNELKKWENSYTDQDYQDYFLLITKILSGISLLKDSELQPSPNFSVTAAKLGSKTKFTRHLPKTLEDLWTLHHQNCLAVLTALQQQLLSSEIIKDSLLPDEVRLSWQKIEEISLNRTAARRSYSSIAIEPIGMHISKKEIILQYNVPLLWHSGRLEIQYDFSTQKLILKGQFLYDATIGGTAKNKWLYAKQWITALEKSDIFTLPRPCVYKEQELTFYLEVPQDRLNFALDEYLEIADYSLSNSPETFLSERYNFWKTQKEFDQLSNHFRTTSTRASSIWGDLICNDPSYLSRLLLQGDLTDTEFLCFFLNLLRYEDEYEPFMEKALSMVSNWNEEVNDREFRLASLQVLTALTKKGQGEKVAIKPALEALTDSDGDVSEKAISLILALFDKGIGYTEAAEAASKWADSDTELNSELIEVICSLVNKGQGFEAAIKIFLKGLTSTDSMSRYDSLHGFNLLVEKGQGEKVAIKAALEAFTDPDSYRVSEKARSLILALFDKGLGYTEAAEAASKWADSDTELNSERIEVLYSLVNKANKIRNKPHKPKNTTCKERSIDIITNTAYRSVILEKMTNLFVRYGINTDPSIEKKIDTIAMGFTICLGMSLLFQTVKTFMDKITKGPNLEGLDLS